MRDEDKSDAGGLLDLFELGLHVLAQLEVQRGERLVQQQHLRTVHERAGDGHALLLSAGEAGDAALLKAGEGDELEHLVDLLLDLGPGYALFPQREGDVLKDVQMGEEGVALENGVDVALVGRHVLDVLAEEDDIALIGALKARDQAQRRGLAAAGGTQQRQKLVVIDIEIDIVQHDLPVEGFGHIFQLNDLFHALSPTNKKGDVYMVYITLAWTFSAHGWGLSVSAGFRVCTAKITFTTLIDHFTSLYTGL